MSNVNEIMYPKAENFRSYSRCLYTPAGPGHNQWAPKTQRASGNLGAQMKASHLVETFILVVARNGQRYSAIAKNGAAVDTSAIIHLLKSAYPSDGWPSVGQYHAHLGPRHTQIKGVDTSTGCDAQSGHTWLLYVQFRDAM